MGEVQKGTEEVNGGEGDSPWGEQTMNIQNRTPEACVDLLTNVSPIYSIKTYTLKNKQITKEKLSPFQSAMPTP